jgi:two-component system, LuxR family, sensor kinase FixL
MRSPHNPSLPAPADHTGPHVLRASRGYALAVGTVAAALVLRSWLEPWLGAQVPYLPFFPAILLTSWYGGFGPGLLASLLSALAAMYFVLPPGGLAVARAADLISLSLFLLTSLGIASLNGRLRRAEAAHRLIAAEATARAERLAAVFNTAVDGIIVIDRHGLIEAFNPGAERLFGYSDREVSGKNVSMLMPSPYHEEHDGYLSRYLETGAAKIIGRGREVTGLRKDGTTFPLHLSVGETSSGGERKFTGILHDLTARVQMEAQLRERTALARLGEMAAVIAHEVKNPLAGIRGAIQVIGSRMPPGTADAPVLQEIVSRIDALNEMMKDLLLFARPPKPRPVRTDVAQVLRTTIDLLSRDPGLRAVTVEVHADGESIVADGEMLKIVFHNLLVNAAHAMKGQGTVRVDVQAVNGSCRISFSDNGLGIAAEIREKVFTPFFTTKSRGSGLGLATAKRLVEAHNGDISIECPPDGGTRVVVRLPAAPE